MRKRYAVTHPWFGGMAWQARKFRTKLGARRWQRKLSKRFSNVRIEKI